MSVNLSWMYTPQQNSVDCAIFVIRCVDCLSRNVPLDFTQVNNYIIFLYFFIYLINIDIQNLFVFCLFFVGNDKCWATFVGISYFDWWEKWEQNWDDLSNLHTILLLSNTVCCFVCYHYCWKLLCWMVNTYVSLFVNIFISLLLITFISDC